MEQNPLHSKDLNYGVPNLYNAILDELIDEPLPVEDDTGNGAGNMNPAMLGKTNAYH